MLGRGAFTAGHQVGPLIGGAWFLRKRAISSAAIIRGSVITESAAEEKGE